MQFKIQYYNRGLKMLKARVWVEMRVNIKKRDSSSEHRVLYEEIYLIEGADQKEPVLTLYMDVEPEDLSV